MKISREIKVGLVFLASVAIFVWGFNFLKGTSMFSGSRLLYAVYDKVDGLDKANKVKVNGLNIGQVKDLDFLEGSSKIVAEFYIKSEIKIPVNSVARIYATDLLGSKAVEIILGDSKEYLQSGDTLKSEMESSLKDQLSEQVEPLKKKALVLINSVDSVMMVIQSIFNENTRSSLASSLENIRNTLGNLESASSNIDTILISEKTRVQNIMANAESISRNLRENNENINTILTNFASLSDSLADAEIPQTLRDASMAVNNLKVISDKINHGEGTLGQLIANDSLYLQLNNSMNSLNLLLEDIRLNPKKYVKLSLF